MPRRGGSLNDAHDAPAYPIRRAARYLRIPKSTLWSWVSGEDPVIEIPRVRWLSFNNLVEAKLLKELSSHGTGTRNVRTAVRWARKGGIDRLLLSEWVIADGEVFIKHDGKLVNLSKGWNFASDDLLAASLRRIERDEETGQPTKLHPPLPAGAHNSMAVTIDPLVMYGRPTVSRNCIPTWAIVQRVKSARESVGLVAYDYGIEREDVEDAILFEAA